MIFSGKLDFSASQLSSIPTFYGAGISTLISIAPIRLLRFHRAWSLHLSG